jgi:putative transposase
MDEKHPSVTAFTEAQRAEAFERFQILQPFLEQGVTLTAIAQEKGYPLRTLQDWVKRYRQQGLAGLLRSPRQDRGKRRGLPADLLQLIEGLALQKPKRTIATIYRQICAISEKQGWPRPSYSRVYDIVCKIDPALLLLAHEGAKAFREEFDLVYRRAASHANAMWQADHSLLNIWFLDTQGQAARPWLSIILDDYSRAIAGYRLSFQEPSAFQTALTLRQAIWRKEEASWHVCGIPSVFYTDHGSDFTSHHMEQVACDLHMELIFSLPGAPRGRGKIERFFLTVDQLFLPKIPGAFSSTALHPETSLSLVTFDALFRLWLLDEYHTREQAEIKSAPQARWEAEGFLPQMPESLEQLDLLLLTVVKSRRVHQDGIHFQGLRYLDTTLAAYVGEDVIIRHDPADMAEIRVFYRDAFLCRAICSELAGQTISLKEIIQARNHHRQQVRKGMTDRQAVVEQYLAVHQPPPDLIPPVEESLPPQTPRLKRYFNE